MAQNASIFIKNLTILDAAVLDATRGPVGQSWYVDAILTGPKDAEGIVIDFGTAKKRIKEIIDASFDHRLFVSEHHVKTQNERALVTLTVSDKTIFALDTYPEALCVFPAGQQAATPQTQDIETAMEAAVLKVMSGQVSKIKLTLRQHEQHQNPHYFNYTHSLRHHDGNCQRFHGHGNIIEVLKEGCFDKDLSEQIARQLDGSYLISNEYLSDLSDHSFDALSATIASSPSALRSDLTAIRYTGNQGEVRALVPTQNVIVMGAESTIENIADYIKINLLKNAPALQVIAYEGIQKGAFSS